MEREPDTLTIDELRGQFVDIDFPEYQREPDIWSREQKQRLLDSILRQFDIASIYLYRREDRSLECIDGRQRLNAIMSFIGENPADESDNGFPLKIYNEISSDLEDEFGELDGQTFGELESLTKPLATKALAAVKEYRLTVVYLSGALEPSEFNLQFLRLNLGTLINAGEKLHAMVGGMRDIVFDFVGQHPFFEQVRIPTRRYAREQVAAQVLLQSFTKYEKGEFARARHSDLQRFLKLYSNVAQDDPLVQEVVRALDALGDHLERLSPWLRNRAVTVTLVVFVWDQALWNDSDSVSRFVEFVLTFLGRLNWQVENMKEFSVDERYPYLVEFQRHLTQASVEKPAVSRRHVLLSEEWEQWQLNGRLTGDDEYVSETGEEPPVVRPS